MILLVLRKDHSYPPVFMERIIATNKIKIGDHVFEKCHFGVFVGLSICTPSRVFSIQLKAPDTLGNCQRPVVSLGVSQHMHIIPNLWKFGLNWSSKLRENNGRKKHPCRTSCVLSDAWFRDLSWGLEINSNILVRNYFFLKNYVTSQGAVSHNVL